MQSLLPLLNTSAPPARSPCKHSVPPGAKCNRQQDVVPTNTGNSSAIPSSVQLPREHQRNIRRHQDSSRTSRLPAGKRSPTRASTWTGGRSTTLNSTPKKTLSSPQRWMPLNPCPSWRNWMLNQPSLIFAKRSPARPATKHLVLMASPQNLKRCKDTLLQPLHDVLCQCWREGAVPQDMKDAKIAVTLYKNKGDRSECNNYRGISLLSIVGKLYAVSCLCVFRNLLSTFTLSLSAAFEPNAPQWI